MRDANEVHLPPPRLGGEAPPRSSSFISGFLKSLMSNTLIHVVVNVFGLWSMIPVILAGVLFMFGWQTKPPEAIAEKASTIGSRIKEAATDLTGQANSAHTPALPSPAGVVAGQAGKRIGEKIEDAKKDVIDAVVEKAERKAERDAAAERENLIVEARKLHVPFEEGWSTDKLRAETDHAREEQVIRQPLYAWARAAGLDYLEIWPTKELRQHVEHREKYVASDLKYQAALRKYDDELARYDWELKHGKNARCPRCRHSMRINPEAGKRDLQCPLCRYFFTGYRAIALGGKPRKPEKPSPPKPWSLF